MDGLSYVLYRSSIGSGCCVVSHKQHNMILVPMQFVVEKGPKPVFRGPLRHFVECERQHVPIAHRPKKG